MHRSMFTFDSLLKSLTFYQLSYYALSWGYIRTCGWRMRLIAPMLFCRNLQTAQSSFAPDAAVRMLRFGVTDLFEKQQICTPRMARAAPTTGNKRVDFARIWVAASFSSSSRWVIINTGDISLLFRDSSVHYILSK